MKLLKLDLTAYGRFAGESLDFSPGNFGVHLVHGPNEAGKSTLLRAIKAVLFGMKTETKNQESLELSYRHGTEGMRIGALLENRDARPLHIIRRKAAKNSLRGGDDKTPLDESVVQSLIGLDLQQFSQQFGIRYQELVQGGKAIAEGKGDVGETLFAAALGMASLTKVQKALSAEADALFKSGSNATKPAINRLLVDYKETQRLKAALPSRHDWTEQRNALDEARNRQQKLIETRRTLREELTSVAAHLLAQGDLQQLEAAQSELSLLQHIPRLSTEFDRMRAETAQALAEAASLRNLGKSHVDEAQLALSALPDDQPLLMQREVIEELVKMNGACLKAEGDVHSLMGQRKQLATDLASLRQELGEYQSLRMPIRLERQRIEAMVTDNDRHAQQIETLEKQLRLLPAEVETPAVPSKDATLPPPPEVLLALRTLQALLPSLPKAESLKLEIARIERSCQRDRDSLQPAIPSSIDLMQLCVPSSESMDVYETKLRDLQAAIEAERETSEQIRTSLENGRHRQRLLRQVAEIPSQSDLQQARERRDSLWRNLHVHLLNPAKLPPASRDEASEYETAVLQADDLADRLRRDATQVAELAACDSEIELFNSRQKSSQSKSEQLAVELISANQAWQQTWSSIEITASSPREMRSWLARIATIQQQLATLADKRAEHAALTDANATALQQLQSAIRAAGIDPLDEAASLTQWSDHVQQAVENRTSAFQSGQEDAKVAQERERHRTGLRNELQPLFSAREAWKLKWQDTLASVSFPVQIEPSEVRLLLQVLDEIREKEKEDRKLEDRVKKIEIDRDAFQKQLDHVVQKLLAGESHAVGDDKLKRLRDRLATEQEQCTRKEGFREQLHRATVEFQSAQSEETRLEARLMELCKEGGASDAATLKIVIEQSKRKQQLEEEVKQIRKHLFGLAGSTSLADFITAARARSSEGLRSEEQRLQDAIRECEAEIVAVSTQVGEFRTKLDRFNGADDAAVAEQTAQCLLSQLQEQSEQYIRLRLAAAMLRKAVEAWRETNQDPVLQRASEIFARLTLGSFAGVRSDLSDDGQSILVGVRPNKELVPVEGLSCGTCDQLYLAIRLASLEVQLKHREPLPLIVDDCLINFDDDRSRAALVALGELSNSTQVIVLTHHERLVELAQAALSKDVLFVHRLKA